MRSREVECEDCGTWFEIDPDDSSFSLTTCFACARIGEMEREALREEEDE